MVLALTAIVLATGTAEMLARLVIPGPYSYADALRQRLTDGPRLYLPGARFTYNADGLYKNAPDLISLRISQDRFIEPDPGKIGRFKILFLGGSTTEALYVQESARWVGLLNEPGLITTYNAAQSGANTLDAYYTFKYLEARGDRFDLVVLMTTANDFTWIRRLGQYGFEMRIDSYLKGFNVWYAHENSSASTDWRSALVQKSRLAYAALLAKHRILGGTSVSDASQKGVDLAQRLPQINMTDCAGYDRDLTAYQEDTKANLSLLAGEVTSGGSRLLVLSEATSYGAPSESFYRDLRQPLTCADETARISNIDAGHLMEMLNKIYLASATLAGADTFDLATQAGRLTNGQSGGQYMYDSIHYTARGSEMVVALLRPVLHQLLDLNSN